MLQSMQILTVSLILSSYLGLGLPSGPFPLGFTTTTLYAFLPSPMCHMPWSSQPPWYDQITWRTRDEQCKLWRWHCYLIKGHLTNRSDVILLLLLLLLLSVFCVTNCKTFVYTMCHLFVWNSSVLNWKHNVHSLLTVLAIYSILILSGNYHWSLPAAILLCMWASGWVGHVDMLNEPTESGNRLLSDKIRTLQNTNDALWQHNMQISISQFHGHYVPQDAVFVIITTDTELRIYTD